MTKRLGDQMVGLVLGNDESTLCCTKYQVLRVQSTVSLGNRHGFLVFDQVLGI